MLHSNSLSRMQRARGRAAVDLVVRRGAVRLAGLRQEGSARAFLPSVHDAVPEVVFLNTAGGLTGGDDFAYRLTLGAGAAAVATTQTAERVYSSVAGSARLKVEIRIGTGGRLDWLPQETILFDQAALDRWTEIDLTGESACVAVETFVLGRAAMRERVERLAFRDMRVIRRDGRAVLVEPVAFGSDLLARAGRPALLRGARAVASAVLVAPGAEAAAASVARLAPEGVEVAASGWNGKCIVRLLGPDAWPVRRAMVAVLDVLRGGRTLPRVWQT